MSVVVWLVIGVVVGWLASIFMATDRHQDVLMNVIVSVVGALLGGCVIRPLVGATAINQADFNVAGLIFAFQGAVMLVAIVSMFRLNKVR
jgi:uncharacterized membrane protein YeaQ/YmgE (transglycosylase-associated protein family)